jgi:two-component system, NarL family, response regulator NreC
MTPIRILVVDDHLLFRAGIAALLHTEPDLAVVGAVGSAEEALDLLATAEPDVVLMDISMSGLGGLEGTRRLVAEGTGARVVVLTVHPEEEWLVAALEAGASSYVTKESAEERLLEAIRAAARGEVSLSPDGTRILLRHLRSGRPGNESGAPVELLSGREREVLARTAEGYTAVEIGEQLQISPKTVDTYRQRMMEKLNLHHRSELVRLAIREGLLSPAG